MGADGAFLPVASSQLADVIPHGFFAPVSRNAVDDLIVAYDRDAAQIRQVSGTAETFFGNVLAYYFDGNLSGRDNRPSKTLVTELFAEDGALKALRATYWQRALLMTDVLDCMPQARRDEWNKSIQQMETPEFDKETVYATLREMLMSRERFFAERVDGIFRNLSGEHLTNSPAGFGQRMIIAHLVSSYGSSNHDRVGYINDLRCIIARFMGRGQPRWNASNQVVESARQDRRGEWITLDGGALRLRAYKCGTAHLEVNPELAWRLNAVLATLYPLAIPSEFRSKPKKKHKEFVLFGQPLPFPVLEMLSECRPSFEVTGERLFERSRRTLPNTIDLPHGAHHNPVREQAIAVLEAIGGVKQERGYWEFDYNPSRVLSEIIETGVIPDQKAHQFYPTPQTVAQRVQAEAQIGANHSILEPSAGLGGLLVGMTPDRVTCVEVASLHAKVLRAKGFRVAERDFIEWAAEQQASGTFWDRILMNPPFSQGRAQLHLDTARGLLATGGRLVAVLPSSFRNKPAPSGWSYTYSEEIANEFADTSISVVVLVATRVGS